MRSLDIHLGSLLGGRGSEPAIAKWRGNPSRDCEGAVELFVIHTTLHHTKRLLIAAQDLTAGLGVRITIVAPQVVPYPLALSAPPVVAGFLEERLYELACETGSPCTVRVFRCRDFWAAVRQALPPRSIVIVSTPVRLWPTLESRLLRSLQHSGHQTIGLRLS